MRYGDQERIAVLNAPDQFRYHIQDLLKSVVIDDQINARFLYDFMIVFATVIEDIERLAPLCIHNLREDGKLWMAFPKKAKEGEESSISRDYGWATIEEAGFRRVSQINLDDEWSALRFRNSRFIRSSKQPG